MFNIRTYNNIAEAGLAQLDDSAYQVGTDLAKPDALLLRSHKLHDEPVADSVIAVARAGAGVNNIPIDHLTERGVVVFNTPGANANAVKELVVAGLLLSSRDIVGGINFAQSLNRISDADEMSKALEAQKKQFAGSELRGKTLAVLGLGAIGSLVANMALNLGMNVVGYDPAISVDAAWRLSSQVQKIDSLQALLTDADFLSLHVPDIEATRHLINAESLAWIKPSAKVLNFAREKIVDSQAMLAAIDSGHIARYVTDFPLPSLLGRREVLTLPHIGASTQEAEENCAIMAARQLAEFLQDGTINNSVNFPRTRMGRRGGHRITFVNENVPRVLGDVLGILADANVNVIDLVNKSRDSIAYNIIDIETPPTDQLISAISAVNHVIDTRVLAAG